MAIDKTTNKSALELESLVRVDMKKMSQSELYTLSLNSSSNFNLSTTDNLVIPNTESTASTATTAVTTTRIFAFSHRRHRRHIPVSQNDVAENRRILNSLKKLVAENDGEVRKRKRKLKVSKENLEDEFQGFGVISVNGEEIDLKFLVSVADGEFEAELNKKTDGMVREDELLGFLTELEGRWGSTRKRRKYVDAVKFVKALPANW